MKNPVFLFFFLSLLLSVPLKSQNLMSGKYSREQLSELLIPQQEWQPFPKIMDREGWSKADKEMMEGYLEKANTLLESQIQQATFIIDNPLPAVTLKVSKQSGNFHVVAGAYRMEENAEKKVQELKELGYKARRLGENRYGLHQVVYSSYESRNDALKALWSIKRSTNGGAWLLVQEIQ